MAVISPAHVIGVVGAGAMGAGIAQVAAQAGHSVRLFDQNIDAVSTGLERIAASLQSRVDKGRLSSTECAAILQRIQTVTQLEAMQAAALVIEAVVEDLAVKQNLLQQLEKICTSEALLASNTSSLSITALASVLSRPQRFAGMHFFNPAPAMKLVEVVSGLATSVSCVNSLTEICISWGKKPVKVKSTPGFIVNRVARPFYGEALRLLQEGVADPITIDQIMKQAGGFRMGPFELMDLIGHDVNYAVTQSVFKAYHHDPRFLPSLLQQELVFAGFLGRKTGQGFYRYDQGEELRKALKASSEESEQGSFNQKIIVTGQPGCWQGLLTRMTEAKLPVCHQNKKGPGLIQIGDVHLALTDGRSASLRAADEQLSNLVLFDLALDYKQASAIAVAAADSAQAHALNDVKALFKCLGMQVFTLDDSPAMLVMRTVVMLANEGLDAVNQQVCSAQAVDQAMLYGLNYPKGPLAWAQSIGAVAVLQVLDHLSDWYREDRYRASPLLRRISLSSEADLAATWARLSTRESI